MLGLLRNLFGLGSRFPFELLKYLLGKNINVYSDIKFIDILNSIFDSIFLPIGLTLFVAFFIVNIVEISSSENLSRGAITKQISYLIFGIMLITNCTTIFNTSVALSDSLSTKIIEKATGNGVQMTYSEKNIDERFELFVNSITCSNGKALEGVKFDNGGNLTRTDEYNNPKNFTLKVVPPKTNVGNLKPNNPEGWSMFDEKGNEIRGPGAIFKSFDLLTVFLCCLIFILLQIVTTSIILSQAVSRLVELLVRTLGLPIAFSTVQLDGRHSGGIRYFKGYIGVVFQSTIILLLVFLMQVFQIGLASVPTITGSNQLWSVILQAIIGLSFAGLITKSQRLVSEFIGG